MFGKTLVIHLRNVRLSRNTFAISFHNVRSYRCGIRVATEISAPRIEVRSSRTCYRVQASLEMDQMSSLRIDGAWRIGLAAVIEDTSGHKSYWALAHPPGKADFPHSDSFALQFS
jgi:hypothetical protein